MRAWGIVLIVVGVLGGLLSAFAIDTSVRTGISGSSLGIYLPREVTNIHLQQVQILAFIASGVSFLAGVIFFSASAILERMAPILPSVDSAPNAATDAEKSAFTFWVVSGSVIALLLLVLLVSFYGPSASSGGTRSAVDQGAEVSAAMNELNALEAEVRSFEKAARR